MPSKSKEQVKFMAAAANNPEFAKKVGIPESVAKKYAAADRESKQLMQAKALRQTTWKELTSMTKTKAS